MFRKKRISEECYNLNYSLIVWLNEHLKVYLEEGGRLVDFSAVKIKYNRKIYTQEELIQLLIDLTDSILQDYFEVNFTEDIRKKVSKMYDILKQLHWYMWW